MSKDFLDRNLALEAVRVTEAAALSSSLHMGRGDENAADQAAVNAMRDFLNNLAIDGKVAIGEGEGDKAPMLYIGEKVGKGGPKVDIALDPFPFQGNTTSIEAAWMGVPMITLKGNRYISHFGESINSNLNMPNWIAENYEDYILKAKKFSSDINELSKIRTNLRQNCLQSPVFDSKRLSKHFDLMLWKIWKDFLQKK